MTAYRLSYGGPGYGWYVVEQYQTSDDLGGLHWRERVVAGPFTSKQAAAERLVAHQIGSAKEMAS